MSKTAWKLWSEAASPELLQCFNERQGGVMKKTRSRFPADCRPGEPDYRQLRRELIEALNQLTEHIQEEYDHA